MQRDRQVAPPPAAERRPAPRLVPGYRWIAVRPGPPPAPRRRHRPLGPTPHYTAIPRWGLMDRMRPAWVAPPPQQRRGPSVNAVQAMLVITMTALGIAAAAQLAVYGLLIVNRTRLLHPVVAAVAMLLDALTGLLALGAVLGCAVLLTRWLIARRAGVFARQQLPEPRKGWALWAGCLVPLVNLAWAPVYVIELAGREGQFARLRKPIVVWWMLWAASTVAAVFATATSRVSDAQGIADNTVAMAVAYLLGLVATVAVARVFQGFERRPVERPAHHWVVVSDDSAGSPKPARAVPPPAALESDGQEPAA